MFCGSGEATARFVLNTLCETCDRFQAGSNLMSLPYSCDRLIPISIRIYGCAVVGHIIQIRKIPEAADIVGWASSPSESVILDSAHHNASRRERSEYQFEIPNRQAFSTIARPPRANSPNNRLSQIRQVVGVWKSHFAPPRTDRRYRSGRIFTWPPVVRGLCSFLKH